MVFRMNYCFNGNYKSKPDQNLSGSSKKLTRDNLLNKIHEERKKRQENRLRLENAKLLQSHIRSYLIRKHVKEKERQEFDRRPNNISSHEMLSKLLFFYDRKQDNLRLMWMCEVLIDNFQTINKLYMNNNSFCWLIKRMLVICLKNLNMEELRVLLLNFIEKFTKNISTMEYLIKNGYYKYLRNLLEENTGEHLSIILNLIHRPFQFITSHYNSSNITKEVIISNFCNDFLKPSLTPNTKLDLFPYLKAKKDFPYDDIINYLNNNYLEGSNSLFYSILILEPEDYETTIDSIQVLAKFSKFIHQLKIHEFHVDDSDDEDEEEILGSVEQVLLNDLMKLMNQSDRAKKWLHFININIHNDDILLSVIELCHNLLLIHKDVMRKYLLLYQLGLNSVFLKRLWILLGKQTSLESSVKGCNLAYWQQCHTLLSVFCDMFTFYTQTLTDRENSDTSETFTQSELYSMCCLLKNVSLDLVEVAFPMCRSSTINQTPEVLHLYNSCLNCVKMLYMLDIRKQICLPNFWISKKIHISQDLSRKNYLAKTLKPFVGLVSEYNDEEHLPPLSTIEQRSLAILQDFPFLVSFNARVLLLRELCRYSLPDYDLQRMQAEFGHNRVVIRRTHLYEDAFNKLNHKNDFDLKHKVRIQFINPVGLEEAGVDGGGIFKEFLSEVLKTAFDPNRGLFLMTADNTLYPNPNVHLIIENFSQHYFFIGRLIGKAIFENILVDLPLAEFFLAKLLVDRAPAHYLKSLDPVLYRNLLYLRDYPGDVTDLGLDFTTVYNDLGETKVLELKPNGRNIHLTNDNRLEYIQKLANFKLNTQLKRQCIAFKDGLNSVVPLLWLKLFNHNELLVIIGGDTQEINLEDLKTHTKYGGVFNSDHQTIILFWKVLKEFRDSQRKQLLKFVTSCSRPPLLGFKELNPPFCIQSSGNEDRMPSASTCLNLLKLPIITDEEVLKNKIMAAIEQQAGFELS